MYTIGQVSEMFGLPISTLRYYDKQGLFPQMQRNAGIRQFGEKELSILRIIECLKRSGLELRDIKQYIEWSEQGDGTIHERKCLIEQQRQTVIEEMKALQDTLDILNYKSWYYETAEQAGTCKNHPGQSEETVPEEHHRARRLLKGYIANTYFYKNH